MTFFLLHFSKIDFFTNGLCQADSQMDVLSSGQMVQLQVAQIAKENLFMQRLTL